MAKMKAAMAAVLVLEKEGVSQAFGVPDRINEFEEVDCRHPDGPRGLELAGLLQ